MKITVLGALAKGAQGCLLQLYRKLNTTLSFSKTIKKCHYAIYNCLALDVKFAVSLSNQLGRRSCIEYYQVSLLRCVIRNITVAALSPQSFQRFREIKCYREN